MKTEMSNLVRERLAEGVRVMEAVAHDEALHDTLTAAADSTAEALLAGRKLMVAGNGGSAADAQHIAAEYWYSTWFRVTGANHG